MGTAYDGWWQRHGWTVAILLTAFGLTFGIRTIFAYPVIAQYGPLFVYGGGSDSYYHSRVMAYIVLQHQNLIHDPMLRFPVGATNPREPLFDWMNAVLGLVFAPFFGGNALTAGAWFLDLQAPLWAALTVFPIYLIGREVSGKRTGLIAVLIYPFLSASIDSSIFGYANYLSFYTFLILVSIYTYIRTVKAVGNRRWIDSYRDRKQYLPGLRNFLRVERTAVKWAVFSGVSLGALALSWQGYTYSVLVIGVSLLVAMIIERIRRVDSFGLYVATWIVGLVAFPMEFPYYYVQYGGAVGSGGFATYFLLPAVLFFGVLVVLLPFLLLRDTPWVFSIPLMAALVALGALALDLVRPALFQAAITGEGYFVKTLVYTTVAEAQAPSIDALIIAYGVVTFFLAFVGLALYLYLFAHRRFPRYLVVFLVFAIVSIYLPISATKFFLLGTPAFALLPAEAIRRALEVGGYPELRRNVSTLSDRRSQFAAFRKAFKVRHVVVIALVVAIVLPNIWISIDAGIPGNTKDQFAVQVQKTIPSWLSLNSSAPASDYFGAAGSSLDTPNQYDSAGYTWLSQQDTNVPPANRPAFVSWWDYGFQAIAQGDHPSVADNFQNGIDPAGQFLLSQNESQAIAVLIVTLLQAEQRASGLPYLPTALNQLLAADGVNLTTFHTLLANESQDWNLVVNNPSRYLPVDRSTLTNDNAMYLATEWYLANALPLAGVAKVYDDVQAYTGWSIRYAMSDSRLFPFSGTDTGIYYAPADLTGRIIDANGLPQTFFNVTILGTDGNYYFAGQQLPAGVAAAQYLINYYAPFYKSMIYHIYIGYNGTDIGQSAGIPGISGSVQSSPLMPGWMLQHFMVVYKTAYYCPQANAPDGSSCFSATNQPTAVAMAKAHNGTADTTSNSYFSGGETMLAYYPGETLYGTLALPDGTPDAGVRVTVDDQWGIPHMTTLTAKDGSFTVVLPPGNDTLNFTSGALQGLSQQGITVLRSVPIAVPDAIGYNLQAPALNQVFTLQPASVYGTVYWNLANNSSYVPAVDIVAPGAQVHFWGAENGSSFIATADASGSIDLPEVAPGLYHVAVVYQGHNFTHVDLTLYPATANNASAGLTPASVSGHTFGPGNVELPGALVTLGGPNGSVATAYSNATSQFSFPNLAPGNYTVTASLPGSDERSPGTSVALTTEGQSVNLNLTVAPALLVSIAVAANGQPAANVPVRFVPAVSFVNTSSTPVGAVASNLANAIVGTTDGSGAVTVALPPANYSVYALGYVGSRLYAGVGTLDLTSTTPLQLPTIALAPAVALSGTVGAVGSGAGNVTSAVTAYAPNGASVTTVAASSGAYTLYLPSGTYSLEALQGGTVVGAPTYAALASVALTSPTRVALSPSSAVAVHFTVGTTLPDGAFFAATNATGRISGGTSGPSVPFAASPNGTVVAYVPTVLPLASPSYCLSAAAAGFTPSTTCNLSPNGLAAMSTYALPLDRVPVTLTVVGLPSGTPVTVNLTAESATAVGVNVSGGPTFSLALPPGVYGVGAKATVGNGSTVYLPSSILNTTIPFGATRTVLTLILVLEVNSTGSLQLPASVPAANVTVALASPGLNVSVNGTAYTTTGFHVAPGTYTATVSATQGSVTYTNVSTVTVSSTGAISPKLVLNRAGVLLSGALVSSAGSDLSLSTPVTLLGPSSTRIVTAARAGAFSATVPPNTTYRVFANATGTTTGPNGTYVVDYASAPGATCSIGTANAPCNLPMLGTIVPVWVNGTLSSPGVPGLVAGTVRLVGPYPYANLTVVPAVGGTFSAQVLPGAYSVYASGGGGSEPLAAFSSVLALPSTSGNVSIVLVPTWTDTITVAGTNGTGAVTGPANVTVTGPFGERTMYPGVAPGAPFSVALPVGVYSLRASAPGTLGGIASPATASATVTVTNGNLGTVLALTVPAVAKATGTLVAPTSATVAAGGVVTFSFSVRAAGNVPVEVRAVGSPAYWNFAFTQQWFNLTPNGPAGAAEVQVDVPNGTVVDHPPVAITFELANGTVVGSVGPAPVVNVVGYYGLSAAASAVAVTVGPRSVLVPFSISNTGNLGATVRPTVADAYRLLALGWNATIVPSSGSGSPVKYLAAESSVVDDVNLTAVSAAFAPPGSVTVSVTAVNASGAVAASVTLPIPAGQVGVSTPKGGSPLTVTGPSVGSPPSTLPDWLVPLLAFAPTIALVVAVASYRWWRTRRWTRR